MANSKNNQTTSATGSKWVRGNGSCPHSSDGICGPCKHALEVRGSMSRDRLTPVKGKASPKK